MKDWTEMPEAQGPLTEPAAGGYAPVFDHQALAQHSIRLPMLNPARPGEYVPLSEPVTPLSPEMRDKERADAARLYERRQAIERAAMSAGMSALEAAAAADRIQQEARDTARKATS